MKQPGTLDTFGMIERQDGSRLILDCVISEEHTFDAEVTDYPVESGGTISDNIRPKSTVLSIEAIVSDVPLEPIATHRGSTAAYAGVEAENFLLRLHLERETVKVRVSSRTYNNVAMESLNIKRNKDTGGRDALFFSARFKQIRTVTNAQVTVKPTSTQGGGGKTKLGFQSVRYGGPKVVLWRKGIAAAVPGGKFIYKGGAERIGDSEYVHYMSHEEMRAQGMHLTSAVIKVSDASSGTPGPKQPIPDGAWFHGLYTFTGTNLGDVRGSGEGSSKKPLTAAEYRRFKLDMARDADPAFRQREADRAFWEKQFDQSPDKTRKPIDLNKQNKKPPSTPPAHTPLADNSYQRGFKQ